MALNTKAVKEVIEDTGVVAIKADKTSNPPPKEIDNLLVELGNTDRAIPFLAIYPAGGGDPIIFKGPVVQSQILDALEKANAGRTVKETKSPATAETAMNTP